MSPRPRPDGAALLVALAAAFAYANALTASFQFDDWNVIVGEPRVQSLAAWWAAMPAIRPLLKLSYVINHATGLGAVGFHAVNVAIHVANSLMVLALMRRWPVAGIAAVTAALVFALHPAQTEAVTYASGRSVSLSGLFVLASLLAWVEKRTALSLLAFACGLATRETAAVLPLALLLWRATSDRIPKDASTRGHWFVLAVAIALALMLPDYRRFFATSLAARDLPSQLLTQVEAVAYLGGQLVRIDRLNADPMLPVVGTITPGLAIAAGALVAIIVLALARLKKNPAFAFAVLWFFLWLAPTNSLLPRLDVANDRQLYLALIGPALLAGIGLATLAARYRVLATAVGGALVLALGMATVARNGVYADEIVFWQDVTAKTPGNARA